MFRSNLDVINAVRLAMTHPAIGIDTPVGRMLSDVIEGRTPNMEDAKRQVAAALDTSNSQKLIPDELPSIWAARATGLETHGPMAYTAQMIRKCASELEAALILQGRMYACEYQVGLYHKDSVQEAPYYRRVIQYRETAQACAEQWRTQFAPSNDVEIRVVPLYTTRITQQMQPVYQVRYSDKLWTDADFDTYYKTPHQERRKLWQPKADAE